MRSSRWIVLGRCFLAYLFDALEIVLLSLSLPAIRHDMGLTAANDHPFDQRESAIEGVVVNLWCQWLPAEKRLGRRTCAIGDSAFDASFCPVGSEGVGCQVPDHVRVAAAQTG